MAGVRALHLSPASGVGVGLVTQREAPDWIHIGLTVGGGKKKKKGKTKHWSSCKASKEWILVARQRAARGGGVAWGFRGWRLSGVSARYSQFRPSAKVTILGV